MSLCLRSYAPTDRASLIEVIDLVCVECAWMSTRRFEPTPAWTHALREPDCPCHLLLVAENSGILGWCRLLPEREAQASTELGIGLLPEYHGRGIGTVLVQSALAWAVAAGYLSVTLNVHPDNMRAQRMFERCGFQYGAMDNGRLTMACDL